jgi:hypothetical protein
MRDGLVAILWLFSSAAIAGIQVVAASATDPETSPCLMDLQSMDFLRANDPGYPSIPQGTHEWGSSRIGPPCTCRRID